MLDWDDLRIFYATSQHGSLIAAAETLGIHRSTVLRRLERLETTLGQRLFDRGREGVTLTAAGERLLPHAERMTDEAATLLEVSDIDHGRPAGAIRVGATFNLAFGLLPGMIGEFRESYPEITIDLVATPDGYGPLHPDDIDIGFRTLEPGVKGHEEMVGRRIGNLPVAVYGANTYIERHSAPASADDLSRHRLVTGGDNLAHIASVKWLTAAFGATPPVYRASSMLLMLAAVRDGVGLACLPRYLGDREEGLVRILELSSDLGAELWILRHPHHRDTARMRAFSEFMSARLPDLL